MDKERCSLLIERLDKKAARNYDAYQETGLQRYIREHRNADELAAFLRIALDAGEEHDKYISMKWALSQLKATAEKAAHADGEQQELEALRKLSSEVSTFSKIHNI